MSNDEKLIQYFKIALMILALLYFINWSGIIVRLLILNIVY